MKHYNYERVKELILENESNLRSASLGMHEDWFWTAETIWEDGKYEKELNNETTIGGINGSHWATPTLELCFKDGSKKMIEVSIGENTEPKRSSFLGVLSQAVQDDITPLSK